MKKWTSRQIECRALALSIPSGLFRLKINFQKKTLKKNKKRAAWIRSYFVENKCRPPRANERRGGRKNIIPAVTQSVPCACLSSRHKKTTPKDIRTWTGSPPPLENKRLIKHIPANYPAEAPNY
jgi:hypothetical protein